MPSVTFNSLLFGGRDSVWGRCGARVEEEDRLLAGLGPEFACLGRKGETVKWESGREPIRFRVVLFLLALAYLIS